MTVGGMGFIPERLLMMMMMMIYRPASCNNFRCGLFFQFASPAMSCQGAGSVCLTRHVMPGCWLSFPHLPCHARVLAQFASPAMSCQGAGSVCLTRHVMPGCWLSLPHPPCHARVLAQFASPAMGAGSVLAVVCVSSSSHVSTPTCITATSVAALWAGIFACASLGPRPQPWL